MVLLLCDRCGIKIGADDTRILVSPYRNEREDADEECRTQKQFCSWECVRLYTMQQIVTEKARRPNGG